MWQLWNSECAPAEGAAAEEDASIFAVLKATRSATALILASAREASMAKDSLSSREPGT